MFILRDKRLHRQKDRWTIRYTCRQIYRHRDARSDRLMHRLRDKRLDKQKDRQTKNQTHSQTEKRINRLTDRKDRQIDIRTEKDNQINKQTDGQSWISHHWKLKIWTSPNKAKNFTTVIYECSYEDRMFVTENLSSLVWCLQTRQGAYPSVVHLGPMLQKFCPKFSNFRNKLECLTLTRFSGRSYKRSSFVLNY